MIATTIGTKSHACRTALIAALGTATAALSALPASAVNPQVRAACANDYLSNCSAYDPESAQTRKCMRSVGYKLSKGCIAALVAAGEVSKGEVARRSASNRR